MKAIHNRLGYNSLHNIVVLYPKDTEKWKQFTTDSASLRISSMLFCIPKILKNESNSQLLKNGKTTTRSCFVSQRYWKMKAIHNDSICSWINNLVVLYPKDTEKWKQFTTIWKEPRLSGLLFCIPKILKNESNSQLWSLSICNFWSCFVSQRYWKMKAIHNKRGKIDLLN